MAEPPSNVLTLDTRWGRLELGFAVGHPTADSPTPRVAISYDAKGRRLSWNPAAPWNNAQRVAVDVEDIKLVPEQLGERLNEDEPAEFFRRWTRLEVVAKLLDVSAHVALNSIEGGADPTSLLEQRNPEAWFVETIEWPEAGVVVSLGALR